MTLSPIAASAVRIATLRNEALDNADAARSIALTEALDILVREGDLPLAAINYLAGGGQQAVDNLAALVGPVE